MDGAVVVTGALGYLGTAMCRGLAERGRPCIGLVRALPPHAASTQALRAVGDFATIDETALATLLRGAHAVVHLAGRAHVPDASAEALAYLRRDNVEAAERVARAAARAGVPRFLHVSSVKVNGEWTAPGRPFRPGDAPAPADAYARSKLAAEEAVRQALADVPTSVAVLRLPLVYGRGAPANFARLVAAVRARRLLPLASIRNRRHLLALASLVEAVVLATEREVPLVGTHFVADADSVSTPDLVRAIAAALGTSARLVRTPPTLLRAAGRLTGRADMMDRLTRSLEVDTRSVETALAWQPAPFRIDAGMLA